MTPKIFRKIFKKPPKFHIVYLVTLDPKPLAFFKLYFGKYLTKFPRRLKPFIFSQWFGLFGNLQSEKVCHLSKFDKPIVSKSFICWMCVFNFKFFRFFGNIIDTVKYYKYFVMSNYPNMYYFSHFYKILLTKIAHIALKKYYKFVTG